MSKIADEADLSVAQLALAWCIRQPGITSAITGASKTAQLKETVKAAEAATTLDDEIITKLNALFKRG